jgi:hypothetical protein
MFLLFSSDCAFSPFPSSGSDWLHALWLACLKKLHPHCNHFIVKLYPDSLILKMEVACFEMLVSTCLATQCQQPGDYNVNWFSKNRIPFFPAYNAHPKLFCIPFEVQITRTTFVTLCIYLCTDNLVICGQLENCTLTFFVCIGPER